CVSVKVTVPAVVQVNSAVMLVGVAMLPLVSPEKVTVVLWPGAKPAAVEGLPRGGADGKTPETVPGGTPPTAAGVFVKLVFSWYWLFGMIGTTEMPFAPAFACFVPLGSDTIKMPRANRVATGNSFQDNFMAMFEPPKETIPRPDRNGLCARESLRLS